MRHVVIPDVHENIGRLEYIVAEYDDPETHFVLLGDYFDSFTHDIANVRRLCVWLNDAAQQPEKYTLLLGNHDMQYLVSPRHRCTGYHLDTERTVAVMLTRETRNAFRYHAWIGDDVLCTHAGLSQRWVTDAFGVGDAPAHPSCEEIRMWVDECVNQFLHRPNIGTLVRGIPPERLCTAVGRARGGFGNIIGGLTWCDWDEEFVPVKHIRQIVGHSEHSLPDLRGGNWCIDTNLRYVAVVDADATIRIESVLHRRNNGGKTGVYLEHSTMVGTKYVCLSRGVD